MPHFDMHCHLDFASNTEHACRELDALGVGAFAVGVMPDVEPPRELQGPIRFGAGLHPWWVADGQAGEEHLELLVARIARERFVGEVGLDFGKTHGHRQDEQVRFFTQIAAACAQASQRVLSIHAVASAALVLDILEEQGALDNCTCILHWYSGPGGVLARAVAAGCYFSVGQAMLSTRRGADYARQIPRRQLLLETDYPPQGEPYDVAAMQDQLDATLQRIAHLRSEDAHDLALAVEQTSRDVLG